MLRRPPRRADSQERAPVSSKEAKVRSTPHKKQRFPFFPVLPCLERRVMKASSYERRQVALML